MSYVQNTLDPREIVVYQAKVSVTSYMAALLMFALAFTPGQLTSLISTELAITDKRVIGKTGLFFPKTIAAPFSAIETVRAKKSVLGDYGHVAITTKTGSRVVFRSIAHPKEIQRRIEEATEIALFGHKLSDYAGNAPLPDATAKPSPPPPAFERPATPKRSPQASGDDTVW